jgi:pseudouridine synthase
LSGAPFFLFRTARVSVRLQKYLAEAGVASRRACEQLMVTGRVAVNGKVVSELGSKVDPARDQVTLDGKLVRTRKKLYVALHKPAGCVCSRKDERGRRTIYELLPPEWTNVQSVGRLDYDTEGLLLLTNDGELSLRLTHPRYGVKKLYEVTVEGRVAPEQLAAFTRGIQDEGQTLRAQKARIREETKSRSVIEMELTEGKNREVRRMCAAVGLTVEQLVRTQIGKIKLGELRAGRWRALTESEIKTLLTHTL